MLTEDLSYFQEEEFKKNLALYEQMVQSGRSVYLEADELTDIAEYYLTKYEQDKAMRCIKYALEIHPDSVDPMIFLARQKMFNGDLAGAKNIRDSITDQQDREVIFLNAEILLREQKEEVAHLYLEQKEKEEEEDIAIFAYDSACLFMDYGYAEYTARWLEKALKLAPGNMKIQKLKAEFLLASNQTEKAVSILNDLLDNDPYNLSLWHDLEEAYFISENYQKTIEAADFALAIDEHDAQSWLLKANSQFQQQFYEEAHHLYIRYFKECTTDELPYLSDGICLLSLGRNEEALGQLLHAEKLSQGFSQEQPQIYSNIAEAYSQLHLPDKAFEYVNKLKQISPDCPTDLYKGHIMLENGRREEGLACYESFIQNNENSEEAHFYAGLSLMENREYEEAIKHLLIVKDSGYEKDELNNKTDACLAFCSIMQGDYHNFLYYLERACTKDKDLRCLKQTIGRFIPEDVAPDDFYQYVLTHPDFLISLSTEGEDS